MVEVLVLVESVVDPLVLVPVVVPVVVPVDPVVLEAAVVVGNSHS